MFLFLFFISNFKILSHVVYFFQLLSNFWLWQKKKKKNFFSLDAFVKSIDRFIWASLYEFYNKIYNFGLQDGLYRLWSHINGIKKFKVTYLVFLDHFRLSHEIKKFFPCPAPNPQKKGKIFGFLTTRFIVENFSAIKRVVKNPEFSLFLRVWWIGKKNPPILNIMMFFLYILYSA